MYCKLPANKSRVLHYPIPLREKRSYFHIMALEIKSIRHTKSTKKLDTKFSPEQLEILKEEYSKKLVNEEMDDLESLDTVDHYRKKYHVSKRDALEMIGRNIHRY